MMTPPLFDSLIAALVEVLNASTRPPALRCLARVKYPLREIQPTVYPDGTVEIALSRVGHEYKHRGARPANVPVDLEGVKEVLESALPNGYHIFEASITEKKIILKIRRH